MAILKKRLDSLVVAVLILANITLLTFLYPQPTAYDYYTRLSAAFLQGRLCLPDNPAWLNELIPIAGKGYCVVYPIAPSILLLPLIAILPELPQTLFAHLIFGVTAGIIYLYLRQQKLPQHLAMIWALVWNWATIFLTLSAVGSSWYLAQTVGSCFLWLSLLALGKSPKRLLLAGLFLSIAATSRLPLHLYCLYVAAVIWWQWQGNFKTKVRSLILFTLGFLPFFLLQRVYNYERFHTFADAGYYQIPGKFNEADFQNGEFNPVNIPKHVEVLFALFPRRVNTFPYFVPSYYGLTILLTSPFILIGCLYLLREKRWLEAGTVVAVMLLEMSHGSVGFTQFGYRFALDAYPLAFLGFVRLSKRIPKILVISLVILSLAVNLWGLLAFKYNLFIW